MANLYDTPTRMQFRNTYVSPNFNAMYKMGQVVDARYNKALEDSNMTFDVNSIMEHDVDKQDLVSQFEERKNTIVEDLMKTGNTQAATLEINKLKQEWAKNDRRAQLGREVIAKKQYTDARIKQGDNYAQYKDKYADYTGYGKNDEFQEFTFSGMGERQDRVGDATKTMGIIKDSSILGKDYVMNPESGLIEHRETGQAGVTPAQLRSLANSKADEFLQTPGGRDFMMETLSQNPEASQEQLIGAAADFLYDTNSNQLRIKTTNKKTASFMAKYAYKNNRKKTAPIATNYTGVFQNPYMTGKEEGIELDGTGNIVYKRKDKQELYEGVDAFGVSVQKVRSVDNGIDEVAKADIDEKINLIKNNSKTELTDKQAVKRYNAMIEGMASQPSEYVMENVSTKQVNDTKLALHNAKQLGNFGGRPIYKLDAEQKPVELTPDEYLEIVGDNYDKGQVVGSLKARNPMGISTGQVVETLNADGKPVTFILGRNSIQEEAHFAVSHQMAQSTFSGKPTSTTYNGQYLLSKPVPLFYDDGSFKGMNAKIEVYDMDGSGNPVGEPISTTNLDTFEKLFEANNPFN